MHFKGAFARNEVFITPAFGIINERGYYGYPVIAIGFAWLRWRCKIEIGVKKTRWRPWTEA